MNETAVDNQLFDARKSMVGLFDEGDEITADQAMALVRLAYGKGYTDALKEDPESRTRMAVLLGLLNTETGEIC